MLDPSEIAPRLSRSVTVCCSVLHCVAVCVAVCCSVLQCDRFIQHRPRLFEFILVCLSAF